MFASKILVLTDLSPEGERALAPVAALARETRASVVLLHVIENVGVAPVGAASGARKLLPGTNEEIELVRAELEKRRARLADIEIQTEVIVAPSVPDAITDYAQQQGCGLIALSSHGRGGFRRMIMGSVAEAVLRRSRVPVLVFPRQE